MRSALLGLAILVAGCASPVTQLMVVVGSDLRVPDEIDTVEIRVTDPGRAHAPVIATDPMLPVSLGIVHRGGPLGPVRVEVLASRRGVRVVRRTIETELVAGEVREVRLDLIGACVSIACPDGETCVAGACSSEVVQGTDLPPWTGEHDLDAAGIGDAHGLDAPGIDGGGTDAVLDDAAVGDAGVDAPIVVPDAGMLDVPAPVDAACSCALDHAVGRCSVIGCVIDACETGWSDCDLRASTGCERSIRTIDDCGACGRTCLALSGTTTCGDGTCRIAECHDDRRADCNGSLADGCEIRTENDADHCGACGMACPEGERCMMSRCRR